MGLSPYSNIHLDLLATRTCDCSNKTTFRFQVSYLVTFSDGIGRTPSIECHGLPLNRAMRLYEPRKSLVPIMLDPHYKAMSPSTSLHN